MQFANPIWLWALAGLSIPVAIHLLSRKEGKVIRIGSLRHLQETTTQQFKGIRLNEIVLLTLRCFLIILFVLLMSGLSFRESKKNNVKWVVIEKGLENKSVVKTQLEELLKEGYEAHLLADNFPLLADSAGSAKSSSYWKLTEALQAKDLEAVVISTNRLENYTGMRPSLPSNIRWISIPSEPNTYTLSAIASHDSVTVRTGNTNAEQTHFTTKTSTLASWNDSVKQQQIIRITLVADAAHQHDRKIMEASIRAIDKAFPANFTIINATPEKIRSEKTDWVVWLANTPAPSTLSVNTLQQKPNFEQNILVQKEAKQWVLTKRLNAETALNENLTIRLATMFFPEDQEWRIASQKDVRMMPDFLAWNKNKTREKLLASLPAQSAEPYLIVLLLIALLAERILAYHRNQ